MYTINLVSLAEGVYPIGTELPQQKQLANELKCSIYILRKVLKLAFDNGLLERNGNKIWVGKNTT